MEKEEKDETKKATSLQVSSKCERLKRTSKDRCMVIGETKMYYGNNGSVYVMSPIPGSPNPGTEPEHLYIRPESSKEALMPLQGEQKDKPKKGKKSASKKKNIGTVENKDGSPKYALPPLKAVPENKGKFLTREKKGREPCHLQHSKYSLGQADSWIPQPGFKSSGKKTTPKNTLISESSSLKYESHLKLLKSSKYVPTSPSLETTAIESVRLPPIRGVQRRTESAKTHTIPTVQFINLYKGSDQLPPLKVSSMPMAFRNEQKEYYNVTKGYRASYI
ncbi:uncharacterized protein [Argopecten irradians]|uniref:uncharacterized protein n=1 Tax=Argopecten irradians TaxID=31199 RepID=UPI00371EA197